MLRITTILSILLSSIIIFPNLVAGQSSPKHIVKGPLVKMKARPVIAPLPPPNIIISDKAKEIVGDVNFNVRAYGNKFGYHKLRVLSIKVGIHEFIDSSDMGIWLQIDIPKPPGGWSPETLIIFKRHPNFLCDSQISKNWYWHYYTKLMFADCYNGVVYRSRDYYGVSKIPKVLTHTLFFRKSSVPFINK